MSQNPPNQKGSPDIGSSPPKKSSASAVIWVLVGLIAVVAFMLYPVFQQAKAAALLDRAMSNGSAVSRVIKQYCPDYDDRLPPMKDPKIVANCLAPLFANDEYRVEFEKFTRSCTWNDEVSRFDITIIRPPDKIWLFHSNKPIWRSSFLVGFVDGHVKTVDASQLKTIKSESSKKIVHIKE